MRFIIKKLNKRIKTKRIKTKKRSSVLDFNQSQWLKSYIKFSTEKGIETEKKGQSVVQINGQCYIWKNNGKLKKLNRCKTSKQQKMLFKMYIKTKLFVAQNI